MILQALVQYYEDLLANGKITRPGWTSAKVSWALELDENGQLMALHPLQQEEKRGKKTVLAPCQLQVPEQVKRSSGVAANFLCDNSAYMLGIDGKGKPERAMQCFAAAKELHLAMLQNVPGQAAQAVRNFFINWDPKAAEQNPALEQSLKELYKGGNLVFLIRENYVQDDPEIQEAWQRQCDKNTDAPEIRCLVTGQKAPLARLHPAIKGVTGAQSSGASIVSFNADAFCSYGHEQGGNAPVGSYAAFAYAQALNYLLADREHVQRVGDTTIVCWAAGGETAYQQVAMDALFAMDAPVSESDVRNAVDKLVHGQSVEWQNVTLDPQRHFYVLGLAPNAARLSVRFFWQDTFQTLLDNVQKHYDRLEIVRPAYDKFPRLGVYWLLQETVNTNSRNPSAAPQLAGDVLRAILNNTRYPATLLDGVMMRIRAEQKVTRGRAAIIKAYYWRNEDPRCPKEVLTVGNNKETNYQPYVMGQLFAVLEAIQMAVNPDINTTIKDRYFNAAASTPATVFPTILMLAQKHMQKMSKPQKIYYDKQIAALAGGKLEGSFPARLTLPEQGAFILGYYHQTQERYTKKVEE